MRGYTAKHFLLALFCSPPIKQVECEKRGLEILYRSLRSSYGLLISNKVNDYFSSRLLRNFWLQNWTKSTSSCQFRPLHNSGIIPLTLKPIQANSPYLKLPLAQLSAFPKSFSLFPNAVYSLQLEIWFGCSSLPPGLLAWLRAQPYHWHGKRFFLTPLDFWDHPSTFWLGLCPEAPFLPSSRSSSNLSPIRPPTVCQGRPATPGPTPKQVIDSDFHLDLTRFFGGST